MEEVASKFQCKYDDWLFVNTGLIVIKCWIYLEVVILFYFLNLLTCLAIRCNII